MRQAGPACTLDAQTFAKLVANVGTPPSERCLAEALGVLASSPRFNAAVVVDVLTATRASVNWITVAELFDHEGFTVSDTDGFSQLCSAFRRGSGQQLPLEAVVGRRWRNASGQLALLRHATLAPAEVFTFEGATRKLDGVPAGTPNQAWLCRDLLAVLASLADAGHMARVREILEHPARNCAETLVVGVVCVSSEYGIMQREVLSALLPPLLSSGSGGVMRRLASLDQGVLLEALAETCTRDPSHTFAVVDVCHDLQVLSAMLDVAPCSLSLELALVASRKQLLDLEQWLVSAVRRDPNFLQAAVLFLDKREQALHGARDDTPLPNDVRVLLRVVDQAGVRGAREDTVGPHLGTGDSTDTTAAPRFGRDVEDQANAYFQNLYSAQLSVDDLVTLLRQLQSSRDTKEQQVLGCMVQSLIDEYRFFPRYPDKELRATSLLLGTLIREQLIPSDKWDSVLRFVADALRKPPGGKMFAFGLLVLRRCGTAIVLQWPQFGMQLIQVPALNEVDPELYASLVQAVALKCGGGGDAQAAPAISHAHPAVVGSQLQMAGATVEAGSGDQGWQHTSQHLAPTRVPPATSAGSGHSPSVLVDAVGGRRVLSIDGEDKDGSVLAAQVANMSLLPGAPSLAALVNTESLESAAEKFKVSFREPGVSIVQRVHFIMNNLSMSNVDSKIEDIRGALLPDFCAWFANYMVVRRAAQEANYHLLYVSLCDKLGDKALHLLLVRTTLYYVKILLYSERTVKESNDRALLKNLGVWLGLLTFAKNRPVLSRDLELKAIVIEAYQRGRLIAVLPFVQKLLECCRDSQVFKPTNPMIAGILSLLAELHSLKGLKINNAFCIELVFKAFNIAAEDVKPTDVLRTLPRDRQCNPDWGMDNLGEQSGTPLTAHEHHASTASMADGAAASQDAAAGGGVPLVHRRYEQGAAGAAGAADGGAGPPALGGGGAAGAAALAALAAAPPPRSSMGVDQGALSPVHTLIVISPQLAQVSDRLQLRRVVLSAMDRAILEILTPVVERSVTIACYTTVELLLKDFAMDPDESRMRSAAHLMVSTLAGSLALVTSKDPLRASLANALKAQLQATPGLAPDMLDSIVGLLATDNLDLGCSAIERAATEKAARDVDNLLQPAYDARIKARAQGKVFADTSAFHGRFPHSLPETLRPRPGQLDAHMLRVYEDFHHTPRPPLLSAPAAASSLQDPSGTVDAAGAKAVPPGMPMSAGTSSYMERFQLWQVRAESAIAAKEAEGPGADQSTLQQLLQELSLSIGTLGAAALDTVALCAKRMLKQLCDGGSKLQLTFYVACLEALALGPGGKRLANELSRLVSDEASPVCKEVVEMLARAQLLDLPELDAVLNKMLLNGQHSQPSKLLLHLATTCIARGQVLTYRDLGTSLDTLGSLAARAPGNEAILHALDAARTAEMPSVPVRPSAEVPAAVRGKADPDGLREQTVCLFEEWLRLVSVWPADDPSVSAYLMALRSHGLLALDDKMDRFVCILVELSVNHALSSMDTHASAPMSLLALDALVRLCSAIVTHGGTDVFLSRMLGVLAGVLKRDADERGAAFNSRPFLRILSGMISELAGLQLQTDVDLRCLQAVGLALHQLQPVSVPAFAFAWLELIGHRAFAPRIVCVPQGSLLYRALVLALLNFLEPYLRASDMTESVRALYRGTLRLLLVLLHDFPEFLCEHHQSLCDAIPTPCVQMRNLVLSAFPRHMRLPDPFSSNLKVDVMPEILTAPRLSPRPEHRQPQPIKAAVELFLRTREPASVPKELAKLLMLAPRDVSSTGCAYDVPAINALMLFIGSAAAGAAPEGSPAMQLLFGIVSELEAEGRYLMFNAIANQLRFPNSHTHFYSCVVLNLFSGVTSEAIKEQITRVLLERLIVNRPHPWGLLVTFIELIKNPRSLLPLAGIGTMLNWELFNNWFQMDYRRYVDEGVVPACAGIGPEVLPARAGVTLQGGKGTSHGDGYEVGNPHLPSGAHIKGPATAGDVLRTLMEQGSGVEAPGRARARAARPLSSGTSALYQVDMECDEAHATAVKGALHARMAPLEVDCGRMRAAPAMLLDSGGPVDDAHYLVRFTPTDTLPWTPAHVHSWLGANGVRADWVVQYQCGAGGPVPVQWRGAARGQGPAPSLAWLSAREPGFVASVHGGHAFVSKAIRAPHVECRQRTDAPSFCRLRVSRLPLSMLGPARPARAAGAAGAPGGPPPGGPPPGGTPPDARAAGAPGAPGGPPPGGLPPRPPLGGQAPSYAAAVQGLHAGPGVQHQLGTIEEGADDEDHDSYGHGAGDGDDDEDGAGPGGGGSAEAAIAAAAAAAAAAAGPSDERAANLVLREHALAAERQKRVQVDQLLAERRAFEDRQKATAAAAAVGAAAAAVGKEALQADRDREERMLDATQSAGRKRAGGDEELDAADDAPLGTPVGLRQPEPRRGEAAPEAAEDGEEGRRMARRRTGGDEGGVAMPAAAPAAAGPDGIPVDVWRKLGEPAFVLLAAVFTAVGAAGETPPGFLDGVVASIYKAKDAADAANYRPLTMLGSNYRILAKVLATRWTPLLAAVVGPEQTALLAGRRISDNICLTQMLPGLLAANAAEGVGPTGAALALLDFRKAYDTIDRGCLLAVMEAVGVGDGVLAWTRTILTHTYASAEVNGFISEPRRYAAGVRQGCPAAPVLFLFLGHALACFLRTCPAVGVEVVPGCRVTCPQYADDCMPLLRSCAPADVAALVEAMAVFGRATGLVLNLGKCGILPLGSAGEGLLAGAEVAGLRVLDAGVSLGVPVSAGLPPPEAVTGGVAAAASRWVRAGVWAVVAALVVDAMERGCRHLWRITRPRDGVLPPDRTVSVERAGALATMDLWNALASFAEGGVMPRGWAGEVGPTHPYVGVVDGKLILNKAS
ncbi:hypothetical protein FOA52_010824 [Chlamydomonas sp. UWO 241]|nr:hypothetical protein FOA52_010824 [Chlamydomonas sp. UWO 241]